MTPRLALLAALALPALAGCTDTARTLGFTRDAPDEFQVTTRAPLTIPGNLGDLPPPRPGTPRPQEVRSAAAVLGAAPVGAIPPTPAEQALITQAGGPVDDGIRRQVDAESARLDRPPQTVVDRLMFWRDPPPAGITVDPTAEARRLRDNAALGRDTSDGVTPVNQPQRPQGFLDRLFGR